MVFKRVFHIRYIRVKIKDNELNNERNKGERKDYARLYSSSAKSCGLCSILKKSTLRFSLTIKFLTQFQSATFISYNEIIIIIIIITNNFYIRVSLLTHIYQMYEIVKLSLCACMCIHVCARTCV